ncbi:MAG TPA: hypothetical protein VMU06_22540 [Stellaceae bacterium]|nr:hypothetical protein [Stellaceae bacterium]
MAQGVDAKKGVQTDRQTGAALDRETVERLRRGVVWMQKNRGLRLKDVAVGCDVAEHTVRNFAYGKAARPDNTFLGRLVRYLEDFRDTIPSEFAWNAEPLAAVAARRRHATPLRYEIVHTEVPFDENDLIRVYERYSGYYLCFWRAPRSSRMSVSWLHIRARSPATRAERGELLMPRFTLYNRIPDRIDTERHDEIISVGYVATRHGNIFLTGQHDGEPRYMILREPSVRKFVYLEGLRLTTAEDRSPLATRVLCQYLGLRAARRSWQSRISLFSEEEFRRQFDNSEVVERVLGNQELRLGIEAE